MFYFPWTRKPDFSKVKTMDYDEYWKTRGFELNRKLKPREEIFLDWIEPGSRVLDFGCGNSLLPVLLKTKGCTVTVADISQVVLEAYETKGIQGIKLNIEKMSDLSALPQFDVIILSEVLEHTRNPEEIIQVLRAKTVHLAISVPNSAYYRYRFHLFFAGRFFTQWVYHPSEHLRFWSHKDFLDWLVAQDLIISKMKVSNGFGKVLMYLWPNLFGHQLCYLTK